MATLREWIVRLWGSLRPHRQDADLEEELRLHLELAAEDERRRRGGSIEDARRSAVLRFGGMAQGVEALRDRQRLPWLDDLARDLRYALRGLRRNRMFGAVAVLTLALGIGATTAIFSLADAVIFRDLPVSDPARLVQVRSLTRGQVESIHSYPFYREIRDRSRVFSSIVCAGSWALVEPVALDPPEGPRREMRARLTAVSGNYFDALGVTPALGRTFTSEEDQVPGASPVAVLSYRFWRQAFDADPKAIDARLTHNGVSYQILGVAPASFTGISSNDDPDVWVPMMMVNAVLTGETLKNANTASLYVFGRLQPGVNAARAADDVARIYRDLQRDIPGLVPAAATGDAVPMSKGVQSLRPRFERPLLILLGVVGLLLLIGCANLAALLTARSAARQHEIAVRLSLGASTSRVVRQLLTESLLLGLTGGALGLMVAAFGSSRLIGIVTSSTRRLPLHFSLDLRIVAFAAAVSMLTAILFGLLPALQAVGARAGLRTGGKRIHGRLTTARLLLAGQMALSLFLLIAASLFIRSLGNLRQVDTGFTRENVLVLSLDPRVAYGQDMEKYHTLYRDLRAEIERLPGVRSASFGTTFFGGSTSRGNVTYEGQAAQVPREQEPTKVRISPGFADALGLSLVAGRVFTDRDDRKARAVAMVSESIARRYFPAQNPIGKQFSFDSTFQSSNAIEIVGVVRDVRYNNLRQTSPYTIYLPLQQSPSPRFDLQVRTAAMSTAVAASVQEAIRRYDPGVRVVHAVTLERLVEDSIAQDRLLALLAGFFGALALVLSAVGLYGITSYGVQRRTSEIGVRMALGASRRHVQSMVLREVLVLVAAGAAIGIPLALLAAGVARGLLFDLTTTDPLSIAAATAALILVTLLAGYLPARRATRIEALQALRSE